MIGTVGPGPEQLETIKINIQSNPVHKDTEGGIENVPINGVPVLNGLSSEKM